VPVALRFALGGSAGNRILVACMRRLQEPRAVVAIDHRGCIAFATAAVSSILGHRPAELRGREFRALLCPPYNALHTKWLRVREKTLNTHLAACPCPGQPSP
jgi:transcriptional regulator of aromatic amino acid metabolism